MNTRGYTLFEVVVYLALLVIFVSILGRITLQVSSYAKLSSSYIESMLQKQLFFDLMRRDIMSASSKKSFWDGSNRIFRKTILANDGTIQTKDVMFYKKGDQVLRMEGEYDFVRRVWKKREPANLCCMGVKSLVWELDCIGERVKGVLVACDGDFWYLCLRNRQIYK